MQRYRICRKDLVIRADDGEWCRYKDVAELAQPLTDLDGRESLMSKPTVLKTVCNSCVIYHIEAFDRRIPGDEAVEVSTTVEHEDWDGNPYGNFHPHEKPQVEVDDLPYCGLSVAEARGLVTAIEGIITIIEDPPKTMCADWKNNHNP